MPRRAAPSTGLSTTRDIRAVRVPADGALPPGATLALQTGFLDASGSQGFTATAGVVATAP